MKTDATKTGTDSFEKAMAELEGILQTLSSADTTLDESVALYAKAAALIEKSHGMLNDAKLKIEEIDGNIAALKEPGE